MSILNELMSQIKYLGLNSLQAISLLLTQLNTADLEIIANTAILLKLNNETRRQENKINITESSGGSIEYVSSRSDHNKNTKLNTSRGKLMIKEPLIELDESEISSS